MASGERRPLFSRLILQFLRRRQNPSTRGDGEENKLSYKSRETRARNLQQRRGELSRLAHQDAAGTPGAASRGRAPRAWDAGQLGRFLGQVLLFYY